MAFSLRRWRPCHLPMTVADSTAVIWQGSASVMSIALRFAGPPLLLFLLWLAVRPPGGEPVLSARLR